MKMQTLLVVLSLGFVALFSGCATNQFSRISPPLRVPENASNIYTFSFVSKSLPSTMVSRDNSRAFLVVNGQTFQMQRDPIQRNLFTFDYQMPPGQRTALYYYYLEYDYVQGGVVKRGVEYSATSEEDLHRVTIIDRYPIQVVSNRGPVGANVALVGRGFTPSDVVVIGDREATTKYESPNSLRFTVPSITAGQTYPVKLRTAGGDIDAGTFRVDPSIITVLPQSVNLTRNGRELLIFTINFEAPAGGLAVDVTTDVPASIIMPEVVIPAGSRTVSISVTGGEPGIGTLYVEAEGFDPVSIPVTVQ